MFRSDATLSPVSRPFATDWTTREFLEWIGADDARCHDASLVPVLTAVAGAGLAPSSPVALVRALAARVRTEPGFARTRVRDLLRPAAAA